MIRRVDSPEAFRSWLASSVPGETCIYRVGANAGGSATAEEARKAGRLVFLSQKRREGEERLLFEYRATRISPDTADWLDALQEYLRDQHWEAA